MGHGPPARHHPITRAQGKDFACVSFPGRCPRRANHHRILPRRPRTHKHAGCGERWAKLAGRGKQSPDPNGDNIPLPPTSIPRQKGYRSRGRSQPRGEVPEDGVQPSRWPRPLSVLLHRAWAAGALCPQPDPTNTAGDEQGPVGGCSLCLGCTCASSRACSERPQKPCREPRAGRVCRWEGLLEAGTYVGKAQRMLLHVPSPFPYFSPSLPAVTELQGFHQPRAESNAWRFWAQTTAEAGTDIFFISCL